MAQGSTHSSATEAARTDFVPAARFELAAYVNVSQPDNQQNEKPSPSPDNQRRHDETVMLIAALAALTERGMNLPAKHKRFRAAMGDGGVLYLVCHSRRLLL